MRLEKSEVNYSKAGVSSWVVDRAERQEQQQRVRPRKKSEAVGSPCRSAAADDRVRAGQPVIGSSAADDGVRAGHERVNLS